MLMRPNNRLLSDDVIGSNDTFVFEDFRVSAKFCNDENILYQ